MSHQDLSADGRFGPARYGLGPYYRRLADIKRSDEDVREDVERALFYDTWLNSDAIEVDVDAGVVVLTGKLTDYDEVRYAVEDAWEVDGVVGVLPRLEVQEG